MSTIFDATSWNLPMGCPNCSRSLAYAIDVSSSRRIAPTALGEDAAALPRHRVGEEHLAGALAAEPIRLRHLAVLEEHLAHGRGAQAHLVGCACRVKGPASSARPGSRSRRWGRSDRVDVGEGEVDVGDRTVGDEHLAAVEHVGVALLLRRGARIV